MKQFAPVFLLLITACGTSDMLPGVELAHLGQGGGSNLEPLRTAFRARNPGYDVAWHHALDSYSASEATAVFFIQSGTGKGAATGPAREARQSELAVGDIVLLRPGETLSADGDLAAVRFDVPEPPGDDLPTFIRPDWDPNITDTPGGCATEAGAYRRILITWLGKNGPYLYHALNAHRVRITDSFSHYHPVENGFDEIYLVQMAGPEARLVVSEKVDLIESPQTITEEEAAGLLEVMPLQTGDLVFMPRGTMHRGMGNVLAQVISVPGFVPETEIGVDHHLKAINERLGLAGERALPYHAAAAAAPVVK